MFRIWKSINIGPLRINISGSGIGISFGIPGLRVGNGPRGSYINVSSNGVSYRKNIKNKDNKKKVEE